MRRLDCGGVAQGMVTADAGLAGYGYAKNFNSAATSGQSGKPRRRLGFHGAPAGRGFEMAKFLSSWNELSQC